MSGKRKDSKGRILRNGEFQRKDGKYEYKYLDTFGERHSVYSWKLVDTDKAPTGKRCNESLRAMEKRIENDVDAGIDTYTAQRTTLNMLFDKYMGNKPELKQTTRSSYLMMYNRHVRNNLGKQKIISFNYSKIKEFYLSLIYEQGLKPNTVAYMHAFIHPVFTMAVRDGYIRTNPSNRVVAEIMKGMKWKPPKRHALTEKQQEAFVNFVVSSDKYRRFMPMLTVLLGTGCRIGEIIGLRWEDCDFKNKLISINHNTSYCVQPNGKYETHITTPKTQSSVRIIPMLEDVKNALLQEREVQMKNGFNRLEIDGYSGFIFFTSRGLLYTSAAVGLIIDKIRNDYNAQEQKSATDAGRPPLLIPHFTAHNLRHTFCTRFCENETNLKIIQEIMGHANISTTMDVYNEATKEKKIESFNRLEGKIKIV